MINLTKGQKGFTLIELLITLAVMAIIATIAFPFLTGIQDAFRYKADAVTAQALAKQIQMQIAAGSLSENAMNSITSSDLGETLPDTKLKDGTWVLSHDGATIKVLYDRNANGKKDAKEPYAERSVIEPFE